MPGDYKYNKTNKRMLTRFILILSITCSYLAATAQDNATVCDVELKGKEYALHLVELGDNLFRISQKYNSTIDDIWEANPTIVDNTIIPGQVIKVPKDSKLVATSGEIMVSDATPPIDRETEAPKLNPEKLVYHEVEAGQTLFAISRLYAVSITELRQWNDLASYDLSVGQKLIVSAHGELKVFDEATAEVTSYQPSAQPIKRDVTINKHQDLLYQKYLQEGSIGHPMKKERGAAAKLITNNRDMQDVYYALHKTAPVGSVIKVVNLVNRKSVFVTVLAPLPPIDENENIQIKMSPAATKELVLLDGKSLVEISYHDYP